MTEQNFNTIATRINVAELVPPLHILVASRLKADIDTSIAQTGNIGSAEGISCELLL